jgi:DNA-binding XRE family transcriptional regulator
MIVNIEIYARDYIMKLKNNLNIIRKNKKLSREKIAQMAGISYSAYSDIEAGRTIPKLTTAILIAKVLDTAIEQLFNLDIWADDSK